MVMTLLFSRFGIFVSLLAVIGGDSSDELTLRMISSSTDFMLVLNIYVPELGLDRVIPTLVGLKPSPP